MKNIIWQHLSLNLKGQIWLHSPCSLLHYLSSLHPWHACQKEYSNSRFNRTSIAYKQANLSGYGLCKPCKSWQKKQLQSQFHDPQRGSQLTPQQIAYSHLHFLHLHAQSVGYTYSRFKPAPQGQRNDGHNGVIFAI